jgi:hypothetical protein
LFPSRLFSPAISFGRDDSPWKSTSIAISGAATQFQSQMVAFLFHYSFRNEDSLCEQMAISSCVSIHIDFLSSSGLVEMSFAESFRWQ